MFLRLKYLLFKFGIRQFSESDIVCLTKLKQVNKLEYALTHGNYKTRKLAAEALGILNDCSAVPVLLNAIDDKVHNVSIAALNALDSMQCEEDLATIINHKRFFWFKNIQERDARFNANKGKKTTIYKWERSSRKNFEIVKEQLKRPMR